MKIAAKQYGALGRDDLTKAGLERSAIWRRVKAGQLEQVRPNAFRVVGSTKCWEQDLMAVQVWAGPESRVSHRAAARLLNLDAFEDEILEITTTRRLRPPTGVVVHLASRLQPYDRTRIGPIVSTTAARTLLDLGGVADIERVEEALEDALKRRLTTIAALEWELKQEGGRGRPGSKVLSKLLEVRPRNHVPMASTLEIYIDRVLRATPLPSYVRQYKIQTRVGEKRPDFAFPDYTVAVEGDGYTSHGGRKAWLYDLRRDRALEALGWDVIHVTWDDIRDHREEFIQDLYTRLARKGWCPPRQLAL